jgi:hypothetical protein
MKANVFACRLAAAAFIAISLLGVGPVRSEERALTAVEAAAPATEINPRACSCPSPINITLNANTPSVFNADFLPGQLTTSQTALNFTGTDRHYVHTFQWKQEHCCCQITDAVLTVQFKANQGGQSTTSSDAGNDDIALMSLGVVLLSERVFVHPPVNFPFNAGQTATKILHLSPAALLTMNANHRLSFDVEDDTSVTSATLQLTGCCLTN